MREGSGYWSCSRSHSPQGRGRPALAHACEALPASWDTMHAHNMGGEAAGLPRAHSTLRLERCGSPPRRAGQGPGWEEAGLQSRCQQLSQEWAQCEETVPGAGPASENRSRISAPRPKRKSEEIGPGQASAGATALPVLPLGRRGSSFSHLPRIGQVMPVRAAGGPYKTCGQIGRRCPLLSQA